MRAISPGPAQPTEDPMGDPRRRPRSSWLIAVTLMCLISTLVPVQAIAAAPAVAAAPFTLTLSTSGGGSVTPSPAGPTYAAGTPVTLTATPAAGNVLVKWTIDGV